MIFVVSTICIIITLILLVIAVFVLFFLYYEEGSTTLPKLLIGVAILLASIVSIVAVCVHYLSTTP